MLIDRPDHSPDRDMLMILGTIEAGELSPASDPKRIRQGCYEIGHFNFDLYLPKASRSGRWEIFAVLDDQSCCGVCDDPEQFFDTDLGRFVETSSRKFVVSFTWIRKAEQESVGDWRWHKWGPYIGRQEPMCEYLYDEPKIEAVCVYHVYEYVEWKNREGSSRFE